MLRALDISTSGLVAQRTRLDAIAGNMANISSVRNETAMRHLESAGKYAIPANLEMASSERGVA